MQLPQPDSPSGSTLQPTAAIIDRRKQTEPRRPPPRTLHDTDLIFLQAPASRDRLPDNQPAEPQAQHHIVFKTATRLERTHQSARDRRQFAKAVEDWIRYNVKQVEVKDNTDPLIEEQLSYKMSDIIPVEPIQQEQWNKYTSNAVKIVFPEALQGRRSKGDRQYIYTNSTFINE